MTVNEIRSKYLKFFEARGHKVIPSAPIVPENDPTTLFTSSGMQPLVPYLMGQPHPRGARLADSQMSIRTGDIEETGDNRHLTFFEMLGNWSLGDYFKAEQLPWFYEFLTSKEEGLGLDPERIYVTTFSGDEESKMAADTESVEIWKKLGVPEERIFSYGAKKNWWSRAGTPKEMPAGEIGGPDSEVFYDFQTPHDPRFGEKCHPNCDCGRFVEIGNSVFMQFIKKEDGSFGELPKKNVDFGGGLERLTATTMGSADLYISDVFDSARTAIERRSLKKYGTDEATTRSFRILMDHTRAATFMIASGLRPANSEQGYILRRLIRRSIREADKLGIKDAVLAEVAEGYGAAYADQYPFVEARHDFVRDELVREEAQFRKTLEHGLKILERMFGIGTFGPDFESKSALNEVDVEKAFDLYQTYGFPLELIQEELAQRALFVDEVKFKQLMAAHQEKSRAGAAQKFAGGLADHAEQTIKYHTTHHLLIKALQMVLGPEVHQRGSNITSERLRLDFSYGQKLAPEQIQELERIVNEKIREELPVIRTVMKQSDAEKLGAEHEFGANYPETVSVYSIGPKDATETNPKFGEAFSIEYCGGPHVANTKELAGTFKILKEEASSAGIRRIKAVIE